ncbi:hypothetical protein EVAR_95521_1 [Eumeta japonica]|uniref:Uncharacterized protein n=1 Tax=Eumeta variegata TaxID=151549 RepID=A0A4C1UJ47_EUMVA|nr:hypothetical protein EVAR_95521_1 [Eumeta japonica]
MIYRPPGLHFCFRGSHSDAHSVFDGSDPAVLVDYGYKDIDPNILIYVLTDSCFGADVLDVLLFHQLSCPIQVLNTLNSNAHTTSTRPLTHCTDKNAFQRALRERPLSQSLSPVRMELTLLHNILPRAFKVLTIRQP